MKYMKKSVKSMEKYIKSMNCLKKYIKSIKYSKSL